MANIAVIHGCCKGDRSSQEVRNEGRQAAGILGVIEPAVPYYTCTLNREAVKAGHSTELPPDCAGPEVASDPTPHVDTAYDQWMAFLRRVQGSVGVEGWWPIQGWRDAHVYLDHQTTRPLIWEVVLADLPIEPYVLLGHSLGSIVALDLIREKRTSPSAFVTVGSPLSLPFITRWVPSIQLDIPWLNIVDEEDPVTAGARATPEWNGFSGTPYSDVWVDNPANPDGDHDLLGYLSQPDAIAAIQRLLD